MHPKRGRLLGCCGKAGAPEETSWPQPASSCRLCPQLRSCRGGSVLLSCLRPALLKAPMCLTPSEASPHLILWVEALLNQGAAALLNVSLDGTFPASAGNCFSGAAASHLPRNRSGATGTCTKAKPTGATVLREQQTDLYFSLKPALKIQFHSMISYCVGIICLLI